MYEGFVVERGVRPSDLSSLGGRPVAQNLYDGLLVRPPSYSFTIETDSLLLDSNGERRTIGLVRGIPSKAFLSFLASSSGVGRGWGTVMVAISPSSLAPCARVRVRVDSRREFSYRKREETVKRSVPTPVLPRNNLMKI